MPEPDKSYFHSVSPEVRKKQLAKATETARIRHKERAEGLRLPIGEDPITCDVSYAEDEVEFLLAVEKYKKNMKRRFPTLRELLNILKRLGYKKPD